MSSYLDLDICANQLNFEIVNQTSQGGIGVQPHNYGESYWTVSLSSPPRNDIQARELDGVRYQLEGGLKYACIYDASRRVPYAYKDLVDGLDLEAARPWGSPNLKDFNRGLNPEGSLVIIQGLTVGSTLTVGDYLSMIDVDGVVHAHMIVSPVEVIANGAGEATVYVRPRLNRKITGFANLPAGTDIKMHEVRIPFKVKFQTLTNLGPFTTVGLDGLQHREAF